MQAKNKLKKTTKGKNKAKKTAKGSKPPDEEEAAFGFAQDGENEADFGFNN